MYIGFEIILLWSEYELMVCMWCLYMDKNEVFLLGMVVDWICRVVVIRLMIRKVVCMLYLYEIVVW